MAATSAALRIRVAVSSCIGRYSSDYRGIRGSCYLTTAITGPVSRLTAPGTVRTSQYRTKRLPIATGNDCWFDSKKGFTAAPALERDRDVKNKPGTAIARRTRIRINTTGISTTTRTKIWSQLQRRSAHEKKILTNQPAIAGPSTPADRVKCSKPASDESNHG